MTAALKLPFDFDAAALKADLSGLAPDEWVPHFNPQYYEGDWSGAALRSNGGGPGGLFADPARRGSYADTPLLGRCPYVREVLGAFGCPLQTVRFLRLDAGSRILEHTDFDLGFRHGVVRVHVPVVTGPEVGFFVGGERVSMGEGECWYLDLSLPHRVENPGTGPRVHLVIDCVVNDWVRSLIEARA